MAQPQRKKVLFLITKADFGGAQRYVFDLAANAEPHGYEAVVAFGGSGLLTEKLHTAGIRTLQIHGMQRDVSVFKEISAFFSLIALFRNEQPDIVHLNSSKAGGLGALVARFAGVPRIIFTAHGWPFLEKRSPLSRGVIYFFSWLTALLSHKTIVVSKYDLSIAQKMPFIAHKTIHIYNGIDVRFPLGSGDAIRDEFPKGVRITGTIGELTKNKNQISLIEQARKDSTMHVVIVGDGDDRLCLKKKIEEYGLENRVKLIGFRPASEVLRGFDVFALPSLKEGLPYVLLEAKAAGLPIVANRVGGVGEILDSKDMQMFSLSAMLEKTFALYR